MRQIGKGRLGRALTVACIAGLLPTAAGGAQSAPPTTSSHRPGARVLLDAHNAYPERGQYADRLPRALATGLPVAIEQDLYWAPGRNGPWAPRVAHDDDALDDAPTLDAYFFARIAPLMEQALADNQRAAWPLLVLNLDFKDNSPEHLDAVWALLGRYERWLTTAPKTATPAVVESLTVGPMLVLAGSDSAQRRRFHDALPVGQRLRLFGAVPAVPVPGESKEARARQTVRMSAAQHIPHRGDNYARWINFPWNVIEAGGQNHAGSWTTAEMRRLTTFAQRAHAHGLWIRFYTLDGFSADQDRGWTASYNFGSQTAAERRWQAARQARVDFIATDQYEAFHQTIAGSR